jgi:hypothetical protein
MTFEEFLKTKKIDSVAFKAAEPALYFTKVVSDQPDKKKVPAQGFTTGPSPTGSCSKAWQAGHQTQNVLASEAINNSGPANT